MNRVWTIGHSTRTAEALVELLQAHDVSLLVDVRTVPRSRHNPQFNSETLAGALVGAGIGYRHEPALGGLRKPRRDTINTGWKNAGFRGYADHMQTAEFARHVEELIDLAERERPVLMCAEAVPWRCHRSLIADVLTVRGVEVWHILSLKEARSHKVTPFAKIDGRRITYPGLT